MARQRLSSPNPVESPKFEPPDVFSCSTPPKTPCPRCGAYPKHKIQSLHLRPVPLCVTRRTKFVGNPAPLKIGRLSIEMYYLCAPERHRQATPHKKARRTTPRKQRNARSCFTQVWTVFHPDREYLSCSTEWHKGTAIRLAQLTRDELPGLGGQIQRVMNDPSYFSIICWDLSEPHPVTGIREAAIVGGSICSIDPKHGFAQIFSLAITKPCQRMGLGRQTYHVSHLIALTNHKVFVAVTESCHSKLPFWLGEGKYTAVNKQLKLGDHPMLANLTHPSLYIDYVLRSKNSVLCSFPLRRDPRRPTGNVELKRASCGKKSREVDKLSAHLHQPSTVLRSKRKFAEIEVDQQESCDVSIVVKKGKRNIDFIYAASPNSGFQRQVYFTANPKNFSGELKKVYFAADTGINSNLADEDPKKVHVVVAETNSNLVPEEDIKNVFGSPSTKPNSKLISEGNDAQDHPTVNTKSISGDDTKSETGDQIMELCERGMCMDLGVFMKTFAERNNFDIFAQQKLDWQTLDDELEKELGFSI